jgi:hypothetical protein
VRRDFQIIVHGLQAFQAVLRLRHGYSGAISRRLSLPGLAELHLKG